MSITKGGLVSLPSLAEAVRAVRATDAARKAAEKQAGNLYRAFSDANRAHGVCEDDHVRACAVLSAVLERGVPDA